MALFTLRSLRKDFGIKEILKDASFSLDEGDKVGLIGTNGSGKSTLLKMIAGLEHSDGGELWVNSSAKIIYLPQQPDLNEENTVLEQVFADSGEQMSLVKEYEEISDKLTHGHGDMDRLLEQLSRVSERMDQTGAWDLETNAKIVLTKLGIDDLEAKIGSLSGGYRKRIAIASALLSAPDVLLMDEPTNHLDALSVEWLQSYLNRYRGALLLITHDRYFLDRVTNRIIEIDRGDLYSYSGNYSYYLEKKAEAEESSLSTQRKHAGLLRRELEWLKKGPKARSTKQKARIDRAHALQATEFKQANAKVDITTAGRRIGKKVVELDRIGKSYGDRTLIKDFSYNFTPEDRIGIIGSNGAGKSTLMNIVTGRLQPDEGTVEIGTTIHFGYFDQHSDDLAEHGNQRVIDYLKDVAELVKTSDGSIITASQMLERFLFPGNTQYAPINKLSGGEKRRLFLLKVLMAAPNVLILDEPTNDLDVQTLAVLEEYLEEFNGCVIVVSHDRYFLDRTVEMVFSFEAEGEVRLYPGNYSIYLEYKKDEAEKESSDAKEQAANKATKEQKSSNIAPSAPETAKSKVESKKTSQLSYKEKREYEELEAKIPKLEAEKTQIEKNLYHNPPSGHTELQKLSARLAELTMEINTSTERWLELAERI
ncbi:MULTISPECIES: ABC-F family ATP-binding cassette domain-containing protein [Cyanophyceae]|jgi:ATP-binding cassette subfamily F protein uup|uniref:ATP-binding cassette domain-containing protein n=1 Tax=Phormidium tenue FACHB-1050 TaxID=2692857 RepID=A0ABR8C9T2_9CYAN|nr:MULTISPECIES: ABC-F family ATP-binding cassette domain-containing protein [Cyanophyceae]MBD2317523.1 ATP-binding cassette domain-containing protein [Phormidium tenue FACHB-1050]MEA5487817.1 ATP-binding cassette domain-containing protein [Pseudanabaena sp. CCNP1317]WGS74445.1 ATP-binding cassette domain-containing protein [Pseudanabaena galeata CCNP1313]